MTDGPCSQDPSFDEEVQSNAPAGDGDVVDDDDAVDDADGPNALIVVLVVLMP